MNDNNEKVAQKSPRLGLLDPAHSCPIAVEAGGTLADPFGWVSEHKALLERKLLLHGAVLFRGFNIDTVETFRRLLQPLITETVRHPEMIAGRQEVADAVYTPTKYPPDQQIAPHNEHSASLTFPGMLAFWCQLPAEHGGETPLIDTRQVYQRIDPAVRGKFERLGWMLVRNYHDLPGRRWQSVFQTESRAEVETYCAENQVHCEWVSDRQLRTRRVLPAAMRHPLTGELSWFNHVTFFHVSALPPRIQSFIRSTYAEEDFPNHSFYGDGSPIEAETIQILQDAYRAQTVSFPWQKGDVLLVDNIATAHARNSFKGPRQILVSLANPITRKDVAFDSAP